MYIREIHCKLTFIKLIHLPIQCPMLILVITQLAIHGPVTQPVVIGIFRLHVHMVVMRNVLWRFGYFVFAIGMEKQTYVIVDLILMMKTAQVMKVWSHLLHCVTSECLNKWDKIRCRLQSLPIQRLQGVNMVNINEFIHSHLLGIVTSPRRQDSDMVVTVANCRQHGDWLPAVANDDYPLTVQSPCSHSAAKWQME